tara:strand:+ start:1179 stop:2342 length:1164 start_codon:yes stop_codon:yes gene_type:complete
MKLKTLKTENQFDTLRLKVPETSFNGVDWNKFSRNIKMNVDMDIIREDKSNSNLWLDETGKGLNSFTYIPHLKQFDIQVSAKVLRDEYHKGIQLGTMDRFFHELKERGICQSVNESEFITNSQVLKADNTFNIEVKGDTANYYDALELVISKGRYGKIDTYSEKTTTTGVVVGRDTRVLQKITIYNKLEEARVICRDKYVGIPYPIAVEREYGMKHSDFVDYFENKLRVELRVNDFNKLRQFYTDRNKGEVFLEDLITSDKNAIQYQWNQFVSQKDTNKVIDFLNLQLEEKRNYKLMSYSAAANWSLLKQYITHFKGDEKRVKEKIRKLFYKNEDGTLKKLSPSVASDINVFCAEYRQNERKAKRGELFTSNLTEDYRQIEEQINKL